MTGPTAIVTGAAKRVGLAIAHALARAWLADHEAAAPRLVLTYNRSRQEAEQAAASLRSRGAQVQLEQVDLSDLAATEKLASRLAADLGRLDVLVHNASSYIPTPLNTLDAEEILAAYRVNAVAPLLLSRRLAPLLSQSPFPAGGSIVAMCDMHALGGGAGGGGPPRRNFISYGMSKAALSEMVRVLARELAPRVRVNGVAPGVVAWPEHGQDSTPQVQRAYLSRVPLQRAGTPDDAASAVRWLALDAAYTTGEIIRIDGGRSLC